MHSHAIYGLDVNSYSLILIFQNKIIKWYLENGRTFSWRQADLNPWQWIVLENLLKKTRADTVEKYFNQIVLKYKSPESVLEVHSRDLEEELRPLGLYKQRCKALREIANKIIIDFEGSIPNNDSLQSLPYIGAYISNAVLCFHFKQKKYILDTNVARIVSRFFQIEIPEDLRNKKFSIFVEKLLPNENFIEYNYGLLDLGALICTKKNPKCEICFLNNQCVYFIHRN